VLRKKSYFGHWARCDDMARREGRREMQNDEGKTGLKGCKLRELAI
jgi:hypothetical protein